MAYGYGFTVTLLRLASAMLLWPVKRPSSPSILKQDRMPTQQVFDAEDAREVIAMMERVTQRGGTATN